MNSEIIFILFLALILFGPKKLPEIGREIGKFLSEFKRASNSFKDQLQSEIEKAGVDVSAMSQPGGQQSSSFVQTLLPPEVTSAVSDISGARDRLMQTARMAFDAQNFTLRPPETPVVAATAPEAPSAPLAGNPPADAETPVAQASAVAVPHSASPVEALTDHPTSDLTPAQSNSAPQSS